MLFLKNHPFVFLLFTIFICNNFCEAQPPKPIWQNKAFKIYKDSVVENKFTGKILSVKAMLVTIEMNISAILFKTNRGAIFANII